jgi:hypothetical protein
MTTQPIRLQLSRRAGKFPGNDITIHSVDSLGLAELPKDAWIVTQDALKRDLYESLSDSYFDLTDCDDAGRPTARFRICVVLGGILETSFSGDLDQAIRNTINGLIDNDGCASGREKRSLVKLRDCFRQFSDEIDRVCQRPGSAGGGAVNADACAAKMMSEIKFSKAFGLNDPSRQYLKDRFEYEKSSGMLLWKCWPDFGPGWNTKHVGKPAGSTHCGQLRITLDRVSHQANRLIWIYHFGGIPRGKRIVSRQPRPGAERLTNLFLVDVPK